MPYRPLEADIWKMSTEIMKIKNLLLLVGLTSSLFFIACMVVLNRGDILPNRLFIEFGLVWLGMLLGYKMNPGKAIRTSCAVIATLLLMLWALRLYVSPKVIGFWLYLFGRFWGLGPLAFMLFGFSHSQMIGKASGKDDALVSALVLSVLTPLIIATAYVGAGWTAREFLELDDVPIERFIVIRESSWLFSTFLRVVLYVLLIRVFMSDPLQKVAESKWMKWIAGFIIIFTGVDFVIRAMWLYHFRISYITSSSFYYIMLVPAIWYIAYYMCGIGRKWVARAVQIRSYAKKMDQENAANESKE